MWAVERRFTIIAIIVAFFLIFVGAPYWLIHHKPPSCTDGKRNQKEVGVDCGGPCAVFCKGGAQDLSVLWTNFFLVRTGVYDAVSYVENPNFNIAASDIPYTFKLYDDKGVVIAQKTGSTFAGPNERFAIFEGNVLTGDKVAAKVSIEIPNTFRWITDVKPEKLFTVTDKKFTSLDSKPKLTALIRNERPEVVRNISVTTVVYDRSRKPIGVSKTTVEKLDRSATESIFFTWPKPFDFVAEIEECEAPVDVVLLLDRSGSMASEGKDPPQPFTRVRDATASFINSLSAQDQVGMLSFSTLASNPIDVPLTNDFLKAKKQIEDTRMGTDGIQYTNTGDALLRAKAELETRRAREEARKVMILLTDGEALEPNRPEMKGDPEYAKNHAYGAADQVKKAEISLYTIGLGVNANDEFLRKISSSQEYYYASPSVSDLQGVYRQIATSICKKGPSVIEVIPRINNVP